MGEIDLITKKLTAHMEDYLEAILAVKRKKGVARVKDVACRLGVRSSSVNSAVNVLSRKGLVRHERYGYVGFTKDGQRLASDVQRRHNIAFRFLTEFLLMDPKTADLDACGMEHAISKEAFVRLTKFFMFLEKGFNGEKPRLLKNFDTYLKTGKHMVCPRLK